MSVSQPNSLSEFIDIVTKTIQNFIFNEELFTILDVSEEVKKKYAVSHQDVRIIAKPILDNIIVKCDDLCYDSTQIDVDTPTGKAVAVLYMPNWEDATKYQKRSQKATVPNASCAASQPITVAPQPVQTQTTAPACVANADWYKVVTPRTDGKVAIPAEALRVAGIVNNVDITTHPNSISIENGQQRSTSELRLSKQELIGSNLFNKPVYVCVFKGKIVVCS